MKVEDCYVREGADALTAAFEVPESAPPHGRGMGGPAPVLITEPFQQWAGERFSARTSRPLNLYLHVPFCRHRCLFCPFYQNRVHEDFSAGYRDLLLREIHLMVEALGAQAKSRPVQSVFFGGGTPSDMEAEDLAEVLTALREGFLINDETEITVEGRVRGFSSEKAEAWVAAGANRFSLGLQSTEVLLRRRLGRLADRDEIKRTLTGLKATGALVIVDLMFGLPGQTEVSLREDVRFLAEETPIDGLDLYELIQFPGSPLAKAMANGTARLGEAADRKGRARMFGGAAHVLGEYGYEHFTPQHWRRTERERSVYNRLAKADADILPFGVSAGGSLDGISLQHERELTRFEERLNSGEFPFRAASPPYSPVNRFRLKLAEAIEGRTLPPLAEWPKSAATWAPGLLRNWEQAGLLEKRRNRTTAPVLTLAGSFWAKHLQRLILGCLTAPSADGGHSQGGHPHGKPPHS